jgi:hypothetical protein
MDLSRDFIACAHEAVHPDAVQALDNQNTEDSDRAVHLTQFGSWMVR